MGIPLEAEDLNAHRDALRALARALVGDEHLAEDVVQDAFVAALGQPPRSVQALKAWLAEVVRNGARKAGRREAERPAREARAWEERGAPESSAGEQEAQRAFDAHLEVSRALRALPEPYRTALYLRFFRDLGPGDLAAQLEVSRETVKTRLRRGLDLLRADLDRRHGGDRRAWTHALAPLFLPTPSAPSPPAIPAAAAAGAGLAGVFTMKVMLTVLALAATVTLVVVVRSTPGGETPRPSDAEREIAAAETDLRPAGSAGGGPVAPADPGRREVDGGAEGAAPDGPAAPAPLAPARIAVVDDRGIAVAGARVAFRGRASVATDTSGRAQLPRIAGDNGGARRVLTIEGEGYLSVEREVEVAGEEPDLGTHVLVRGASIRGRVLDPDGQAVPHAVVLVADPGGRRAGSVASLASSGAAPASGRADEAGVFELGGLPAGPVRVWATAEGWMDGSSSVLELEVGARLEDVTLALAPLAARDEITGWVLLPGAETDPRPEQLTVWVRFTTDEGVRTRTAPVNPDGRFRYQVEAQVPHALWVQAPPGEWDGRHQVFTGARPLADQRGSVAPDVQPGTSDLMLGFEPAPSVALAVRGEDGRTLEAFTVITVEFSGEDLTQQLPWRREVVAPARLTLPTTSFYLAVEAEGYDRARLGALDPHGDVADPLVVTLSPLQPITGRVTAGGRPVPGAQVELYRPAPAHKRTVKAGFLLRMEAAPSAWGRCADDGTFAVTLRDSGRFFVRATAPGWAGAELGPLELDGEVGAEDVDLELTAGGAIVGTVRLPAGEEATGWTVGASRGDPEPRTTVVGPDGSYRFEGLTPGDWLVERVSTHDLSSYVQSSRTPVLWRGNCTVVEGQTTRFDLEGDRFDRVVLRGRLDFDGVDTQGWGVTLSVAEESFDGEDVDRARMNSEGEFELVAPQRGDYHLTFRSTDNSTLGVRRLTLDEPETEWSDRIEYGTLVGRVILTDPTDPPMVGWLAGSGESITAARVRVGEDGRFEVSVPTGPGELRAATPATEDLLPLAWPLHGTAVVEAGKTVELEPLD